MAYITGADLDRVLERRKDKDSLGVKLAAAIALIDGVLDDYGEQAVALSFNGGKDCTVLLHLFAAVLYARHNTRSHPTPRAVPPTPTAAPRRDKPVLNASFRAYAEGQDGPPYDEPMLSASFRAYVEGPAAPPPPLPANVAEGEPARSATHHTPAHGSAAAVPYPPIRSVYFTAPNPFPALETFVIDSATRYGLDLWRFGGGMKSALSEYLGCGGGKDVRAILLGTRQGDPNGNVAVLAATDPSWPQVLRVHPVLDWTYTEVWQFLRELGVPWCSLYDEGFTSLGSTHNTAPNPLLKTDAGYEPAWKLQDPSQERAGRGVKTT
ncbi:uncharacterized protein CcaverHIS019_0302310 [Cutaneotrichosporon cavernicola]|uniref:FAD synthase n=1 Tax=Cutaneotrichosporon cavernicola TaxID=279322 RepID=A0AA48I2Z5_9TREE|nr:uncharacterized protein CcaverHIS019_0302310 [Cutaneotrichosporon cavernicola]BEI90161.1 hypothetical protein CcaverHIS019_0302310 [Cutaneotrichosporon cavernicola]BEI97939.1 hypothetical protein CcaverHIS631_0302380 [Cutaneotrichosporon cavernicola]BEJ05718.1 hypothetical protein CcaverHIS641_0302400 [Cutaneotrichosporon cavernicola]